MGKIRVDLDLIAKAINVFQGAGKKTIMTNEGLTRQELRALERKGLVVKRITYGKRKFTDSIPPMKYAWEWIGDRHAG